MSQQTYTIYDCGYCEQYVDLDNDAHYRFSRDPDSPHYRNPDLWPPMTYAHATCHRLFLRTAAQYRREEAV